MIKRYFKRGVQRIRVSLILIFVALNLCRCGKEEVVEFSDTPILEAYLNPGEIPTVVVSRQYPFSDEAIFSEDDVDALHLVLDINGEAHELTCVGDGVYVDSSYVVSSEDVYNLSFTYNNKTVSAYTYVPTKPVGITQSETEIAIPAMTEGSGPPEEGFTMPDPIEISWTNIDNSYYLIVVENLESSLEPIRDFGDEAPPENIFRKSPVNSSSEVISAMDFQYFGSHRVILYHVLPDYAALYDRNSTSSQNLDNPSTSIENGYGIFTGMNSDTLYIEVTEQ